MTIRKEFGSEYLPSHDLEQTAQVLLKVATDEYGAPPNPPDVILIRQLITEMQRRKPDGVKRRTHAP